MVYGPAFWQDPSHDCLATSSRVWAACQGTVPLAASYQGTSLSALPTQSMFKWDCGHGGHMSYLTYRWIIFPALITSFHPHLSKWSSIANLFFSTIINILRRSAKKSMDRV